MGAQSPKASDVTVDDEKDAWRARPFAIVRESGSAHDHDSDRDYYGSWDQGGERLREYTKAHPGNYLLYAQGGSLYRVDSPALLQEAERLSAPMRPLAEQQRALAAEMAPLSEQQRALSQAMRATHDPEAMSRIGKQQGVVGREQGAIGRVQGTIGRQQGALGRALYRGLQQKLDTCLADKSCSAVAVS